ncbi:YbaY family lipoprotein [Litchfieldella rifensis]|uniref:YbaY family lipoprotein n=1 Tax=Litchfieldella rifensis TaxID=762643 RepID=A0ABV7LPF4_9GAMM
MLPLTLGRLSLLPLLLTLLVLGACASGPRFATLDARVVPEAPLEVPEDAVLRVTLADISQANADIIAESTYTRLGSGPLTVALRYDANAIDTDRAYGLRAEIRVAGRLTHASPEPVPVLTGDAPSDKAEVPLEATRR